MVDFLDLVAQKIYKGMLPWQPIKVENWRCVERPLLFASAFDNGLADRKSACF